MGLFSIDIEKFYEELEEMGQQLKGIFSIQYPIYCIHANITNNTPDPLDNLDKAIVDFLIKKSDFTAFQIGSLMGTSKTLIEKRISNLLHDGLIEQEENNFTVSVLGEEVFKNKTQIRQHKQSYDFFIDGLTLKPLPRIFYTYYNSKMISENDSYYRTNDRGETYLVLPFGPDLVHTPPNKSDIFENIFCIQLDERESYCIPNGLQEITDLSFTKQSLQLLVSVSSGKNGILKQLIDGFAIYSLSENISYYDILRRNIKLFEENIKFKIENLLFKITIPRARQDKQEQPKPVITSNWQEIDKYKEAQNKCFLFSSEDLLKVVDRIFQISHVVEESIINEDNQVVLSINKKMLLESTTRQKLVNDLIRERDYTFGNVDGNIFLLYLYYKTSDEFVQNVVKFKKTLSKFRANEISLTWINDFHTEFSNNYRQLLIAAGEYELLENLDVEKYMLQINK
jgi:hypothetical protein